VRIYLDFGALENVQIHAIDLKSANEPFAVYPGKPVSACRLFHVRATDNQDPEDMDVQMSCDSPGKCNDVNGFSGFIRFSVSDLQEQDPKAWKKWCSVTGKDIRYPSDPPPPSNTSAPRMVDDVDGVDDDGGTPPQTHTDDHGAESSLAVAVVFVAVAFLALTSGIVLFIRKRQKEGGLRSLRARATHQPLPTHDMDFDAGDMPLHTIAPTTRINPYSDSSDDAVAAMGEGEERDKVSDTSDMKPMTTSTSAGNM